jgi:hypothetical protein
VLRYVLMAYLLHGVLRIGRSFKVVVKGRMKPAFEVSPGVHFSRSSLALYSLEADNRSDEAGTDQAIFLAL